MHQSSKIEEGLRTSEFTSLRTVLGRLNDARKREKELQAKVTQMEEKLKKALREKYDALTGVKRGYWEEVEWPENVLQENKEARKPRAKETG